MGKYDAMTGNERLWVSGLMDEFDVAKINNKRRAYEILKSLDFDEASILKILELAFPINILLKAACNYYPYNVIKELEKFKHNDLLSVGWGYFNKEIINDIENRKNMNNLFVFTNDELVQYLRTNKDLCEKIFNESYDKRITRSTFIQENKGKFEVGIYDNEYKELKIWDYLFVGVADYILLTWGLGRLGYPYE